MYGSNIGALEIRSGEAGQEVTRWQLSGDQGDIWVHEQVSIPAVSGNQTVGVRFFCKIAFLFSVCVLFQLPLH